MSSPSASRTLDASDVAAPRTFSLLEARSVALAMTFPVTACVALTDTAVAAALAVDRTGEDHAEALLDGNLLRRASRRACPGGARRGVRLMPVRS